MTRRVADDRDQRGVGRPARRRRRACPTTRGVGGSVSSTRLASPCRNVEQPHEVADADGLLDQRRAACAAWRPRRRRPSDSSNIHSFFGWLTRATTRGHAVLGLGQQRDDEVDLVVAGGGDHDLAAPAGRPRRATAISQASADAATSAPGTTRAGLGGSRSMSSTSWPLPSELAGDGAADLAGTGDGDAHQRPSGPLGEDGGELRRGRVGVDQDVDEVAVLHDGVRRRA